MKKPLIAELNPKRILIIQTAFLGDLALTLPLLNLVKSRWPQCEIIFVAHSTASGLLENHAQITHLISYDKRGKEKGLSGFINIIRRIRKLKPDLAIVPHRSARSALMAFLSGSIRRSGYSENALSWLYTDLFDRNFQPDPQPGDEIHYEGTRNLYVAGPSNSELQNHIPELNIEASEKVNHWLKTNNLDEYEFIAIAIGSVWATKRYPVFYWQILAEKLIEAKFTVVFVGGPDDQGLSGKICDELGSFALNAAGLFNPRESVELLSHSKLLITADSAPLHLATAANTPVLAIFGPTVPEMGFAPVRQSDLIIGMDIYCRPCSLHGTDTCPLGHHECMKSLNPELVYKAAKAMLNQLDNEIG